MLDTHISALGGWPTVTQPFSRLYPSQNDLPDAIVKKNPLKWIFSPQSGEKKRGYPSPIIV
jgi:hypothetical protein